MDHVVQVYIDLRPRWRLGSGKGGLKTKEIVVIIALHLCCLLLYIYTNVVESGKFTARCLLLMYGALGRALCFQVKVLTRLVTPCVPSERPETCVAPYG